MEEMKIRIYEAIDNGEFNITDEIQVRTIMGFVANIPAEAQVEVRAKEIGADGGVITVEVTTILDAELVIRNASSRVRMFEGISGKELIYYEILSSNEDFDAHKIVFRNNRINLENVGLVESTTTIGEMKKFIIESRQEFMECKRNCLKVFISQPYTGYTEKEIFEKREYITKKFIEPNSIKPVYVIDQYHRQEPSKPYHSDNRVYNLGQSISMMAEADIIFFCEGFQNSNGCIAEHNIAQLYQEMYNWRILYEDEDWNKAVTKEVK